jgi:hypothetical protein
VAWVRERTIPTERTSLVGEFSANFCGEKLRRGQRDGSLLTYSRFSRPDISFLHRQKSVLVPTEFPIKWVTAASSPEIKRQGREAEYSPTSDEIKNMWIYSSTPSVRLHGLLLNYLSTGTIFHFHLIYILDCSQ